MQKKKLPKHNKRGIFSENTASPPWLRHSQHGDIIHRSEHRVILFTDMKQMRQEQIEHIKGRGQLSPADYQPLGLLDDVKLIYKDYRRRFTKPILSE
jgi:hypothetical protein